MSVVLRVNFDVGGDETLLRSESTELILLRTRKEYLQLNWMGGSRRSLHRATLSSEKFVSVFQFVVSVRSKNLVSTIELDIIVTRSPLRPVRAINNYFVEQAWLTIKHTIYVSDETCNNFKLDHFTWIV